MEIFIVIPSELKKLLLPDDNLSIHDFLQNNPTEIYFRQFALLCVTNVTFRNVTN